MLAIKIWNYLKGYVIIKVEGLTLERLLNLAASNNVYLWDVKRIDHTVIEMKATIRGFKALKSLVKKVGCRVEIVDKKGFPFILQTLKKRKMLGLGFLMFWGVVILLASFIWKIEILGNEQTAQEEIIKTLKDHNISIGKIKYSIDKEKTRQILLENFDYFSFLSVDIKGTKLTIEIKEQDLPPEKVNKDYPCHIVSRKKGVIMKVVAKNGKSVVKKGDVVKEGQLLITGIINTEEDNENGFLVHSDGKVLALTRYSHIVEESIVKRIEEETGEVYKERGLKVKDKGIQFIKGDVPYKDYIEVISEKKIINLDKFNIDIPIKIVTYEFREVEIKEVKQNLDFLKKSSQIRATQEINKELPDDVQIVSKDVKYFIEDNVLKTQVIIETIEDIGKKQIINNQIIDNRED
jgi:similar to stage IV sporulation protein